MYKSEPTPTEYCAILFKKLCYYYTIVIYLMISTTYTCVHSPGAGGAHRQLVQRGLLDVALALHHLQLACSEKNTHTQIDIQ